MSSINVNGKTVNISGGTISIINGKIYVDGKEYKNENLKDDYVIESVIVHGNVGNIECGGNVAVYGDVDGSVECGGNVNIRGNQRGDVACGGNISIRK